jgi:hypothetical protein
MAEYHLPIETAVSAPLQRGGVVLRWDVISIAAANSWILAVGDIIRTAPVEVERVCPAPVECIVFIKHTDTSNTDYVRLNGFMTRAHAEAVNPWMFCPLHRAQTPGNTVCEMSGANNHAGFAGTPAPWVRGGVTITTSVPVLFRLYMYFQTRSI